MVPPDTVWKSLATTKRCVANVRPKGFASMCRYPPLVAGSRSDIGFPVWTVSVLGVLVDGRFLSALSYITLDTALPRVGFRFPRTNGSYVAPIRRISVVSAGPRKDIGFRGSLGCYAVWSPTRN